MIEQRPRECDEGQSFLVLRDMGRYGAWAVVDATSRSMIDRWRPDLVVFADRPAWMTPEMLASLQQTVPGHDGAPGHEGADSLDAIVWSRLSEEGDWLCLR
jgi:hypothetical protein